MFILFTVIIVVANLSIQYSGSEIGFIQACKSDVLAIMVYG